ncbi:MAG: hypothetical protein PWP28_1261 [Oceanotoga sp.]|uniref:3D domain-containing protein n=1 Tax=Oceanotoga sp. TaxID=2108366 RepID=UPI00264AECE3|nr:3D domain-containing protein [Oceanotoga sp.]MDN5342386.1 hypothetical protein [Oceanotoga sp.]
MKKIYFLLIIVLSLFLSSCSFQSADEQNKLPNEELTEIKSTLKSLEIQLTRLEEDLNKLSDEFYQNKRKSSYDYNVISDLKSQFSGISKRLNLIEGLIIDGEEAKDVEKLLALDDRVDNIEKSMTNLESGGTSENPSQVFSKITDLEKKITDLEKNYTSLFNNDDNIFILDSLQNINDRVSKLENSNKDMNGNFVNSDDFKNLIQKELKNVDLNKDIDKIIEIKTEQAVSKFYYKSQSDTIIKVKELEDKLNKVDNNVEILTNNFDKALSSPPSNLDEKYKTKIDDLEKRINAAIYTLGDEEFKSIFENTDEIVYKVKSGDTLSQIAKAFGLGSNGVDLIAKANNLINAAYLKVGQELIIPIGNIEKYINWPLKATNQSAFERIAVKFGDRNSMSISPGIGIKPIKDERIYPILPGKVVETGSSSNGNWYVKIDHGSSIVSVVRNISTIYVKEGVWVDNETSLGLVKKDSLVMLELWKSGEPKDPLKLFFRIRGDYKATYYTEWDDKLVYSPTFRLTRSGKKPENWRTIAADPEELPLGTVVYIPELKDMPNNGFFVVEDTGGKIKGNKIDIYVNDVRKAQKTSDVTIYVVGKI